MAEIDEQAAVVEYLELRHVPFYHVPSEGKRGPKAQREFKRLGGKAGVPDLCIPVARGGYHGLYIEMKYGKNKPTEAQYAWLATLNQQGYKAMACWGAEQAIAVINDYLRRKS